MALLFLLNAITAFPQSAAVTNSIELAKKTVAPIVCLVRDAATGTKMERFRIIGTASMVDQKGMFITADHVISDMLASPLEEACKPAITFPVGGWKRDQQNVKWFSFDSAACRVNNTFDVAVCRTTEDLSKQREISFEVASVSAERPPDGTSVFFTGFPLQATDPITSIGAIAGYPADEYSYATVIVDKNAWPGASGSPIYLSDGKAVIGMLTKTGTGEAAGLSFGTAGERVSAILANAKAFWEEGQKKASEAPPTPTTQH